MATLNGKYREFRLDSGLLVALQETPTQTIAGRLRVKYGALHENSGEEGLAHFLEHCIVHGGTSKYTTEEVDNRLKLFSHWNATTGQDETGFPVNMLSEYIEEYLDLFSNIAFHPILDARIVDEERQRVLREINDKKSDPSFKDRIDFYKALLGDTPYNYLVDGKEAVIEKATIDGLHKFHSRGYFANNMDLILVGGLPSDIRGLIEKYFGGKPTGDIKKIEFPVLGQLEEKTILHVPAPHMYNKDRPEESMAELRLAWRVPDSFTEEAASLLILSRILGGDPHSRLFVELSRRKGLAYHIECKYYGGTRRGVGIIEVNASTPSKRVEEAVDSIFRELDDITKQEVSLEELERIKRNIKFSYAAEQETNSGHVSAILRKIDFNLTPESEFEKISSVTPKYVMNMANEHLPKNREEGNYVLMIRDPLKN